MILNLKRESNKIYFLKKLEESVECYYLAHKLECKEENCILTERRNTTNNIINSIKMDIEKEKNTSSNFIPLPAYETIPAKYQYVLKDEIYELIKYSLDNYGKIGHIQR